MNNDTLTGIKGVLVGHAGLPDASSGCTVILPTNGAVAGVDIRGGAPGTYGTDSLNPINLVDRVQGVFFTGGSAFGLAVAEGLRQYLTERKLGFDTGYGLVPIVAGAVIFDLAMNNTGRYPDLALGREACFAASDDPVEEGCAGAGLGATVGKLYGHAQGMKSGLGSALVTTPSGIRVGALMVVNAFGDVLDPAKNQILAGCRRSPDGKDLANADLQIQRMDRLSGFPEGQNTVVGAVVTNVKMNKSQLTKVAQMAHDGLARTITPAHTQYDGDTIFALSVGELQSVEVSIVGALAADATAQAVLRAVRKARSLGGLPAHADLL
jgi:L-aminopeptidase/D-esterase-like protein